MNYFLFANNVKFGPDSKLSFSELNLDIHKNDLIILSGKQWPLKFDEIRNHENKIVFYRANKRSKFTSSTHEHLLSDTHHLYKQIINIPVITLWPIIQKIPNFDKHKVSNIFDQLSTIDEFSFFLKDGVPTSKKFNINPSTGFMIYLWLKYFLKKENEKIILVGFTGHMWDGHDSIFEQRYLKKDKSENKVELL